MNPWYKEAYLQFFDQDKNAFVETPDGVTGIYVSYNSGDINSLIPSYQAAWSGLNIPYFKNKVITANPVVIGQLLSSIGPGINIGEWNSSDSPYSIRNTGDRGEIIIGSYNAVVSGVQNINIGNFNFIFRSKQMSLLGAGNTSSNCNYSYIHGSENDLSGIFLSNVIGKNNTLLAGNDINGLSHGDASLFSGYKTRLINIFGDYNFTYSGGLSDSIFGNYNNLNSSNYTYVYGNLNGVSFTSGDSNLILGDRNYLYTSTDINTVGDRNISVMGNMDFILGRSNYIKDTYNNFIYGQFNTISSGSYNTLIGNSNEILGNYNQILGKNIVNYSNSANSTIVGDTNYLSGDFNNYIFGSNNTSDGSILNETIIDFPPLTGIRHRTSGVAGDYNYYIGDNNRSTANDYSFAFGESNDLIDNFKCFVMGSDNKSVSNTNCYTLGNSNEITGTRNAIFIGFNFSTGHYANEKSHGGVGIKITTNGIDIYGPLRVNGTGVRVITGDYF